MMSKKQFEELLKSLKNIEDRLEILINLQKATMPKPSVGEIEKRVLQLCDKKHTIEDIAKETGKAQNNVRAILSNLRDKGLIKKVEIKDRVVFETI